MPRGKEQQAGIDYEHKFAKIFGVVPQVGSGNQWYAKLDVGARELLCSLKHTGKDRLSVTADILREAIQQSTKIGSKGAIPVLGVDIAGEDFVILRTNDFAALLEEEVRIVPVRKANAKRARAAVPQILREHGDSGQGDGEDEPGRDDRRSKRSSFRH